MRALLILAAAAGLVAAQINISEIPRYPDTKGWGVGIGLLAFVGFGLWAIAS